MEHRKFPERLWGHTLSVPFIWLPLIFLILLDLITTLYQVVCFPIYGLEPVKRKTYILVRDRNKLAYLDPIEKLGCMYCGYANGVLLYLKEIAGRTEKYWCGIMHEDRPGFKIQASQVEQSFSRFGDEEDFKKKYSLKGK
ncbi:MAG: hypothetical protein WC249_04345 [Patescibacteria group bacterium]|jgi:hypothetical protein